MFVVGVHIQEQEVESQIFSEINYNTNVQVTQMINECCMWNVVLFLYYGSRVRV